MLHSRTFYNSEKKIWSGDSLQNLYNPDVSIGQLLLHVLERNPTKITQICAKTGSKFTNKEIRTMSIRVCQNLQLKKYKQGDIIGIAASNSKYLAPVAIGAFLCGTPISTLDPSFKKGEIMHMYKITKPKIIFCDSENYQDIKDSVDELNLKSQIYLLKGTINGVNTVDAFLKPTGSEDLFIPPKLKEGGNQTLAILCSSGTTGLPKGVCMSHRALLNQTSVSCLNVDDVLLCFSTLYWMTGLIMLLLGTGNGATRVIIDEPFSVDNFFDLVENYRVTTILGPPSQMAMIIQSPDIESRDLSSIISFTCGGSMVPQMVSSKMQKYLKNGHVVVGYGMSEACGCVTVEDIKNKKLGSVGQLGVNFEVKIIDEDGNSLGIGQKGEILSRSPMKWPGYFGNEKATREIYDDDNWIHSGDLGHFDNEGFLFIEGRKKEILKFKNFHFFPTEIETVISELKDVIEVCVFSTPDLVYTDLPSAAVILKAGSKLSEKDIFNYVAEKMADFKQLRGGVYFLKELPKTASGKVQRNKVSDLIQTMLKSK